MEKFDSERFSKLSPLKRFSAIKWWSIPIIIGIIALFAAFILNYYHGKRSLKEFVFLETKLAHTCNQIANNQESAAKLFAYVDTYYPSEDKLMKLSLFKKKIDSGQSLEKVLDDDFKTLPSYFNDPKWKKYFEQSKQEYNFWLRHKLSGINREFKFIIIGEACASEAQNKPSVPDNKNLDNKKKIVLWLILFILGAVYVASLIKTFFSSNAQNMDLAIDLVKTLTGFFIGVVTTLIS